MIILSAKLKKITMNLRLTSYCTSRVTVATMLVFSLRPSNVEEDICKFSLKKRQGNKCETSPEQQANYYWMLNKPLNCSY